MNTYQTMSPVAPALRYVRTAVSGTRWSGMSENLEARALQGDERAWNALIAQHSRRVRIGLLAKGAKPELAQDLMQETWMRLIRQQRAGKFEELRLPGLAVRQADFLLRSHRRRPAQRVEELDDPDNFAVVVDEAADPEQVVLDRQQLAVAMEALEECSPRSRRIFLDVQRDGLTAAEGALRFGISVQRVRQTLCEVRKKLRVALEAS
jgi:RNA polymerase sigma factor (sigma-70 family)